MSRKRFNNRLENLFDELELEAGSEPEYPAEPDQSRPAVAGWTWECNLQGIVTACSSEIEAILSITVEQLLGRHLAAAALDPVSAENVRKVFTQQEFDQELDVSFVSGSGQVLSGLLHFLPVNLPGPQTGKNGSQPVIKGFTRLSAGDPTQESPPEESPLNLPIDGKAIGLAANLPEPVQIGEPQSDVVFPFALNQGDELELANAARGVHASRPITSCRPSRG